MTFNDINDFFFTKIAKATAVTGFFFKIFMLGSVITAKRRFLTYSKPKRGTSQLATVFEL